MKWKPSSRRIQTFQDAIGRAKGKVEMSLIALKWATSHWLRERSKSWTSPESGSTSET